MEVVRSVALYFLTTPRLYIYAVWCYFIEKVLSPIISPLIIPKFKSLDKNHQKAWYNRTVSTIHAITMFARAVYYWTNKNPHYEIRDYVTNFEAITIDIMMGYLIYDTIYETSTTCDPQVLAHHYIGFFSHLLTRLLDNGSASFYSMMVYIAELSTPFLNASWLINYLNFESSTPLMTCGGILVVSFFFCRVLWGPFMLWHMMNNWVAPPRFLYYINVFIVIFFILLNFYWFYLLLRLLLGKKKEKHT